MTLPGEHPVDVLSPPGGAADMAAHVRWLNGLARAGANRYLLAASTAASGAMADTTWVKVPIVASAGDDPLGMLASNVVTIKYAGLWLASGHVSITNPNNAGGPFRAQLIRTSGTPTGVLYHHIASSPGASWAREVPLASRLFRFAVNDTLELQGQHIGGGTTSTIAAGSHVSLLWIGP